MPVLARARVALSIEPGEARPVALLFSLSVLLGLAQILVYTAGYGLFLERFESAMLPWVYVAAAGVATTGSIVYLRLSARLRLGPLLAGNLALAAVLTALLWGALGARRSAALLFVLPVWYEVLFVLNSLAFWALAGRVLNVRQGKRLFGLVGTGDRIAEITVGFVTPLLVSLVGVRHLLALGALAVLAAFWPLAALLSRLPKGTGEARTDAAGEDPPEGRGGLLALLRSRFVAAIVLQILLTWFVYYAVDLVFYDRLAARTSGAEAIASFVGVFFGAVAVAGLVGQAFVTPRLLRRLGVGGTILLLPVAVGGAMAVVAAGAATLGDHVLVFGAVAVSRFLIAILIGVADAPATLVFYQALPAAQRLRVQGFADGIVYPVAVGSAGLLLVLLKDVLGLGVVPLACCVVGVAAVWVGCARLLGREYPEMIRRALRRRLLDEADLTVADPASLGVLERSLSSGGEREALHAVSVLHRHAPDRLEMHLPALLARPEPSLAAAALAVVETRGVAACRAAAEALADGSRPPPVRAAAIRAASALDEPGVVPLASRFLEDAEPQVRRAAMTALLRYGGIEGVLAAGERILALERSAERADRIALAELIGDVGVPSFSRPLRALLESGDAAVWNAAARAAARVGQPKLVGPLLRGLERGSTRAAAADALAALGPASLAALGSALSGGLPLAPGVLARAVRAVAGVDDPLAVPTLLLAMDHPSAEVRAAAVAALVSRGFRHGPEQRERVEARLSELAAHGLLVSRATVELAAHEDLVRALGDELILVRERLLATLCLRGHRSLVQRAQHALRWGAPADRALALESLDALLSSADRRRLLPVLDPGLDAAGRVEALEGSFAVPALPAPERLASLVAGRGDGCLAWTRACAAAALAGEAHAGADEALRLGADDPDPDVREHAAAALAARRAGARLSRKGRTAAMLTVEKVAVLRSTDVFAETPDWVLAPLARIATPRTLAPGELFIHQGAIEDSMYVLAQGEVEVVIDGKVAVVMGEGTVVGEMQVIDPAPRVASVRARGEAVVLCIGKEAFDDVMNDRPEIARAVNRMLVRRLREARSQTAPAPADAEPRHVER